MAELFRYAAFISYSSKDAKFAQRLHRALESYGIPSSLGKFDIIGGGKKNRIYPVFRDREELSAGQLGEQIEANLKASAALIVVCSPNGAASPWVQKEIEFFVALGRHDKIFAIIPDTAPLTDEQGADCTQSCFPPAFRGDALSGDKLEPLAADARKGKDGFRNAWLKIVAGMVGVTPGQIIDRDKRRRGRQRLVLGTGSVAAVAAIAMTSAMIDARDSRKDMTALAAVLTGQDRTLDAVAFALAGLPAPGAALGLTDGEASVALERTNATGLITDLGPLSGDSRFGFEFSGSGDHLLTMEEDGTAALRDLRDPGTTPRPLGRVLRTFGFQFSDDGRFLLTRDPDDVGALRDLRNLDAAPRPLGQTVYFRFSRDGRFLATRDHDGSGRYGSGLLYDLSNASTTPRSLGHLEEFVFSPDGRFLLIVGQDFSNALLNLGEPDATPRALGRLANHVFSADGRYLLTKDSSGIGAVHDLRAPTSSPQTLGRIGESFGFSGDSRFLMTRDADYFGWLRDLRDPAAAPRPLAFFGLFDFSPDGRFFLATDENGIAMLYDLRDTAAAPRSLGPVSGFGFSPEGRFLFTYDGRGNLRREGNGGALHDLHDPAAATIPLGRVSDFRYSNGDRFLMTMDDESAAMLRDLSDLTVAPRSLGRLSSVGFSSDGRFLLTRDFAGVGMLRDPAVQSDSSAAVRSNFCRVSGDAVRPFQNDVRTNRADNLYARLKGHPWNPCDWRGLLAVFPNAERGDGWFEGVRQWLRLMQVRYFDGADYACAETTSAASDETRARRRDMCARYGGARAAEPAAAPS